MLSDEIRKLEMENGRLKVTIEGMKEKFETERTKPMCCESCRYYIQHYTKLGRYYKQTNCGSCVQGNNKNRKSADSCKYFEFGVYGMEERDEKIHDTKNY